MASLSSATGFSDIVHRDFLSLRFAAKDSSEEGALLDGVHNVRKVTEFCTSKIDNNHLYISTLLHTATIPAHHRAYFFLFIEEVQLIRRISCILTAVDSVQSMTPASSNNFLGRKGYYLRERYHQTVFSA